MTEGHCSRESRFRRYIHRAFTEHPRQTGETYLQHLWFTVVMAGRFLRIGAVIFLHGLFPFLFTRTGSAQIARVYALMKQRSAASCAGSGVRVAIVGGGFSGTLTLANLVRQAPVGAVLAIDWFEPQEAGPGLAYGTAQAGHLLNVRAKNMGAFAEAPDDFMRWLRQHTPGMGEEIGEAFLPRRLYADYLRHCVQQSLQEAQVKGIRVQRHGTRVRAVASAQGRLQLESVGEGVLPPVDALVLATGNQPPPPLPMASVDPWRVPPESLFPQRLGLLPPDSVLLIVGTGLTMVDTVLTVMAQGYRGRILALSRHGWLPSVHQEGRAPYPAWTWTQTPAQAPTTALGLLRGVRQEVARARASGYGWQAVIDSLRPVTTTLWQALPLAEKRRFQRRLMTAWAVHRHRMAPEVAAQIAALQVEGRLCVRAGRFDPQRCRATLVLNCMGPSLNIEGGAGETTLLATLCAQGLLQADPLRLGVMPNGDPRIFPLGNLLVGAQLECTAVPELRIQAQQVAQQVLAHLATTKGSGA